MHLTRHGNLVTVLEARKRALLILIVKNNGDAGLLNTGLAVLVDEVLGIVDAQLGIVLVTEHEADRVNDVRLARTVQACDSRKILVESRKHRSARVRLEAVYDKLLDEHGRTRRGSPQTN